MSLFPQMQKLPELMALESLIEKFGPLARVSTLAQIEHHDMRYPIYCLSMGSTAPDAPTLAFTGGVHGLERIGSQIIIAFLNTVLQLSKWDESFLARLEKSRLVFVPIVNPVGILLHQRSNPRGVDLMRNAPVEADQGQVGWFYSGHRLSAKLPWYRGAPEGGMELESQALCEAIRKEVFSSSVSLSLDVHSGFGAVDRLWFPWAKTRHPLPHLAEVYSFKQLLDATYPHHFYHIEPQARHYLTHGDLWDYLYQEHQEKHANRFYLPLTLEIGSWLWLRKNPRQIFSLLGAFHPMLPHRQSRVLRRHLTLFEFLHRSVLSAKSWLTLSEEQQQEYRARALKEWYEDEK